MTGVEVQPADIVDAAVKACKRAAMAGGSLQVPGLWDLTYSEILEEAQVIADGRVRDVRPS